MGRLLVVAALLPLLFGCAAQAPDQRATYQGSITVSARAIPLPPGEWTVLARDAVANLNTYGGPVQRVLTLTQEQNGKLAGLIFISALEPSPQPLIYTNSPGQTVCRTFTSDLAPTVRDIPNDQGYFCRRIAMFAASSWRVDNPAPHFKAFLDRRTAQPGWAPRQMVWLSYGMADGRGPMHVEYNFDPGVTNFGGFGPGQMPPAQRAGTWATAVDPLIKAGFRTGSTGPAPAF